MTHHITFEEFVMFLKEYLPTDKTITKSTLFEEDLGITGDDGIDLLEETENRFCVTLGIEEDGVTKTFNLEENECLFHSEGFSLNFWGSKEKIRKFTVGELFDTVNNLLK